MGSWDVLKNDRSLVLFPILSTMFAVLAMVATWAFVITLVIVFVGSAGGAASIAIRLLPLGVAVLAATVAAVIVVSFILSAPSQIFRVAVYQYAVTGEAPGGFDRQMLQSAFAQR